MAVQDILSPPNLALPHGIYALFLMVKDKQLELERDKTVKSTCGGVALVLTR